MTRPQTSCHASITQPALTSRLLALFRSAGHSYRTWYERRAAARHLSTLDDHMLKDIGVARCEIESIVSGRSHRLRSGE